MKFISRNLQNVEKLLSPLQRFERVTFLAIGARCNLTEPFARSKLRFKTFYYINCSVLQGFLPPRNVVSEHT